jgi:hypothetical protein
MYLEEQRGLRVHRSTIGTQTRALTAHRRCVGDHASTGGAISIVDGARAPCEVDDLLASDAASYARCETCGYPRKQQ